MKNNELKITVSGGQKDMFKLVRSSELSLSDEFLKYNPKTSAEKAFKKEVKKVIMTGVPHFYCPVIDPSVDVDGRICCQHGMKPAVCKSYTWWFIHASEYCPERKSRLGTKSEYIAFYAVRIKELVASGKSMEWTWNAVCCGLFDIGNTFKILATGARYGGFWLADGLCFFDSFYCEPAGVYFCSNPNCNERNSTGWLVFDSCPD